MLFINALIAQGTPPQGVVNLEVPIGNLVRAANLAEYIGAIFRYGLSIAGIAATVMIVFGGVKWLVAAGDKSKISSAQEAIRNAVIGLVILLTTTLILNTINPELLKLRELKVPSVVGDAGPALSACPPGTTGCLCAGGRDRYGEGGTCSDSGASCVRTTTIFELQGIEADLALGAAGGAVGGAVGVKYGAKAAAALGGRAIAGFPVALLTTAGGMLWGTLSHYEGLYYCTDGSLGMPCDTDQGDRACQGLLKCHPDNKVCYNPRNVPPGGLCEDNDECGDRPGVDYDCTDNQCRGDGSAGDACTRDQDCAAPSRCLKPQNYGIGRCQPQRIDNDDLEDKYCVLENVGVRRLSPAPPQVSDEDYEEFKNLRCLFCSCSGGPPCRLKEYTDLEGEEYATAIGRYKDKEDADDVCLPRDYLN